MAVRGAVVSQARYSPSRAQTACVQVGRIHLEVEIQRDDRPVVLAAHSPAPRRRVASPTSKKYCRSVGSSPRQVVSCATSTSKAPLAFAPDEILLDRDRHPRRERSGDSIAMASLFGIRVVRVNEDAISGLKLRVFPKLRARDCREQRSDADAVTDVHRLQRARCVRPAHSIHHDRGRSSARASDRMLVP